MSEPQQEEPRKPDTSTLLEVLCDAVEAGDLLLPEPAVNRDEYHRHG